MMIGLEEAWRNAAEALAFKNAKVWFDAVYSIWKPAGKLYHTRQHLKEVVSLTNDPYVTIALFFHDAIYNPRSQNNVSACVNLCRAALVDMDAEGLKDNLTGLIQVTDHTTTVPITDRQREICDIDLAILAAPKARYDEYVAQIREEYRHVPDIQFYPHRLRFMAALRKRRVLFHIKKDLTLPAQMNIQDEIKSINERMARW